MANTLDNIMIKPHAAHGNHLIKLENDRVAADAGHDVKSLSFILSGKSIPTDIAAIIIALGSR